MSPELQKQLYEKYPKIFAQVTEPVTHSAMGWGICTGDGWYNLIDALCSSIQNRIDLNPHLNFPQVVATQVKEKFGSLRFYYEGGDDNVQGKVSFAERISSMTCEKCGLPGTIEGGGWLVALCEKHRKERNDEK